MHFFEVLIFISTFALCFGALFAGRRIGARVRARNWAQEVVPGSEHISMLQGALLALLGLLLGFSFSAASSRFAERQQLVVREANAMGTAFLRLDLLQPADRAPLQDLLRTYAQSRMQLATSSPDSTAAWNTALEATQRHIWAAAVPAVQQHPDTIRPVLDPLNDMFDLHAERKAVAERHLPTEVLVVLALSAFTTLFVIGFGTTLTNDRFPIFSIALALLIALALWATIDLDYPRRGFIRLDPQPLIDVVASMQSPQASPLARPLATPPTNTLP
jgi:hypothetical protein